MTDTTVDTEIWTVLEAGIGMIAASSATLRPLLKLFRVTGFSSSNTSRPTGHGPSAMDRGGLYIRTQELDVIPRGNDGETRKVVARTDEISDDGSEDFIFGQDASHRAAVPQDTVGVTRSWSVSVSRK